MRILYLAFVDLGVPRAWTIHVLNTCRELRALGHEIHLVTPTPSCQVRDPDYSWRRMPVPFTARAGLLRFHASVWRELPRWMEESRTDVVYAREVPFAWWLPNRVHRRGRPLVVEVNGIVLDEAPGMPRARRWAFGATERRQLERADGIVAVTPEVAEGLRRLYPRLKDVQVISNGVEVGLFDRVSKEDARRELDLETSPWVGFVGGLFEYRALDRLMAAMALVRRTMPNARLLLIGDGPMRSALAKGSPDGVRFVGDVAPDRVPMYLAAMDVCVLFSTIPAGTSIKVLEYMAARRPIVASRGGGVGRLIADTGAGVLVDRHSPEAIAEALTSILTDVERARRMADNGRAATCERFTWRHSAAALAAYLSEVVSQHRVTTGAEDAETR